MKNEMKEIEKNARIALEDLVKTDVVKNKIAAIYQFARLPYVFYYVVKENAFLTEEEEMGFLMNEEISLSPYSEVTDALTEDGIVLPTVCVYKDGGLCNEKV